MDKDIRMDFKANRIGYICALALCTLAIAYSQSPINSVIATRQHVKAPTTQPRISTYVGTHYSFPDSSAVGGPTITFEMAPTDTPDCASGDLIVCIMHYRGSVTITNSAAGGQTWNALTNTQAGTQTVRVFWCQFNGTWSADPAFTNTTGTLALTGMLHVFRPADGASHSWAVDVSQTIAGYSAPSTPFDVTITGITTVMDTTVVIATVTTEDDNTLVRQTAGWTSEYRPCGIINIQGNDQAILSVYKFMYPKGATGDVTIRQTNRGGDPGVKSIIAFK